MTIKSHYSMLNKVGEVRGSHQWDWFSGSTYDIERWLIETDTSGTAVIDNVINNGLKIETAAVDLDDVRLKFNGRQQYNFLGAVFICVHRKANITNNKHNCGLGESQLVWRYSTSTDTAFTLQTSNGGNTKVTSDVNDTNWHTFRAELMPTSAIGQVDGVLKVTSTSNLPGVVLQPVLRAQAHGANASINFFRYFEAFNT